MSALARVLDGIRVLDLGRFIAAPYCAMILADMGAEVIRLERPGGEDDRRIGRKAPNGENLTFPGLARNKKSITLDLQSPEGRRVLGELLPRCDILLHNFSRGAARAMKLSYPEMRAASPSIIYAAISCFGSGPDADRPGFDPIAQMSSGAASLTGFEGDVPLRCGVPWVDYSTGLCAAVGILLALRHRDASGEGQEVDCSLMQTAISFAAPMIAEFAITGAARPRLGNRAPYLGPADLYRCVDGYVYVAAVTESMWRSLATLIGRTELLDSPLLCSEELRFENRDLVDPLVAQWMGCRTVDQAVTALNRAHIACGVYHSIAELARNRQLERDRMLAYLDLGPGLESTPVTSVPIGLSKSAGAIVSNPPCPGEHNSEIYGGLLGYSDDQISGMKTRGLI